MCCVWKQSQAADSIQHTITFLTSVTDFVSFLCRIFEIFSFSVHARNPLLEEGALKKYAREDIALSLGRGSGGLTGFDTCLGVLRDGTVLPQHLDGLVHLERHLLIGLEKDQQLSVVHLQQHAGDLAGELRLHCLHQGEQPLSQHLLLLLGVGVCQDGSGEAICLGTSPGQDTGGGRGVALRGGLGSWLVPAAGRTPPSGLRRLAATLPTASTPATASAHSVHHHHVLLVLRHAHGGRTPWPATSALRAHRPAGHHCVAHHTGGTGPLLLHGAASARVEHVGSPRGEHPWQGGTWGPWTASHRQALVLLLQLSLPHLLPLGQGHIDRLAIPHLALALGNCTSRFLRGVEAHKTEALALTLVVAHNLGGCDGSILLELLTQHVIRDVIGQVLHVQVHARVLGDPLRAELLKLLTEHCLALALFLGAAGVQLLLSNLLAVEGLDRSIGLLRVLEVDKAKALGLALIVPHDNAACDLAKRLKLLADRFILDGEVKVLNVDICEAGLPVVRALGALHKGAHIDLLPSNHHAIDLLNRLLGSLLSFKVHKAIAARGAVHIGHHLAGQNAPDLGEGVVERTVVDALVQILDENVPHP
mmetsp:Transcript_7986/g.22890  ORF Transcript_7986/g.22890 Transcript_7986/m.22890 type:complete len:591 (-) Transcript_7986:711-2483(-)